MPWFQTCLETGLMQQMTTSENLARNWRRMHIFHANGTVWSRTFLDASVRAPNVFRIAHITPRTVKILLFSSCPTNPAQIAVKLPLISIIIQSTNRAKVKSKLDPTFAAMRDDILQRSTLITLHLLHSFPIELVGLFSSIMTKATWINFVATRSQKGTFSDIMLTTSHFCFVVRSSPPRRFWPQLDSVSLACDRSIPDLRITEPACAWEADCVMLSRKIYLHVTTNS